MVEVRGSWTLHEAIDRRWEDAGLDDEFRTFWTDTTETRLPVLDQDTMRPHYLGPYCVYQTQQGTVIGHDTGDKPDTHRQYINHPLQFKIHAKSRGGLTAKARCRTLAKKVCEAFDPGSIWGKLKIGPDAHVNTIRVADFPFREGDDEWSWSILYDVILDAEYDNPR